ncbi:50S ribosomal protein L3 N(5)-glutamine methyltransferase [Chitinimonas sp. BJB300]|uniref:50S ribosomal protein L3 N(5)-glutamine methyltransferase n=1 Tax=Chitinimonas sp. BJB300 TaxID=1559339 RepID=UPI000C11904A|nr:50S ribosomal protein L3 N(5)-glutamine methyltransferase [Chitinimonas sp. BJB300]PHV11454.1 50S ribosomal protein L3 N(5)-glutamine methyltransferase [Chitinimonas sp. BJB300]TSJ87294.1 50S ribosomal protein L3 N(5)-glutamine methyltransferase [Chitinimonas sp. BJB300]
MFNAAHTHLLTVRDLLRFAVSRFNEAGLFFGHGNNSAWNEAAYLVLYGLNLPLDHLEPFLDARLMPDEIRQVLSLVEARVTTRKPAAYLTHEAWLGAYRFYVDERVIVPRSFIAELLPDALEPWIEYPELVHRALDLCTGSGCLAILLAEHYPDAEVDAVDLSTEALEVAAINVETYGLETRVQLLASDLFTAVEGQTYDLIVSNPPYVDAPSVASLPDEYLHEPELALGSGEDGLDATRAIIENASRFLSPHGILVVEIGHNRDALEPQYPTLAFTWLETSSGDGFVFLLTHDQLIEAGY